MEYTRSIHVSVVGAGEADAGLTALACDLGAKIAVAGCVLVCGGLGGVMAAACRGAMEKGGRTVGIVPGSNPDSANPWAEVVVATGLGHARNVLVVQSADVVIALPGSWGTMSEVALALKSGRPVVGLRAWEDMDGVVAAGTTEEAVNSAMKLARRRR